MIDVVLPCLDEAAALPWVLTRMPEGHRPIVVDNGSTDGSAEIAEAHGALVVHEPRRGFGAACHAGLLAATADIVCFMDADASLDPADLPKVVRLLADAPPDADPDAGRAVDVDRLGADGVGADRLGADRLAADRLGTDLVLGRRRPVSFRAWPPHARLGNALVARRAGLRDLGPMRAARRTRLLDLHLTDRRSGYPLEMVLRARAQGWRIAETDVAYHPRTGRSKVTGTVRGTLRAVRDMRRVLETV
ncbi:glycosyltransferase family 2 protein [Actinoallomurus soli]|uniref:glycosyltransferase family 2 protein n=1 Tax=Actinoallomurus soli TaxID=2952535 RepID=UPI0020932E2D|nr:glycosyltransferase family 2 protein [Actinoallomurus soli]MCO5972966.1 glycosyltransferase family 2 protein [Actinoallomurus soli]